MPGGPTQVVRVAQIDQSTTLRRWRPQVRLLLRTPFFAPVPQQQQGEFRKLVFVGASPTRGSISWWSWCNSSIVPCEGARDGANPFGHPNFDGPLIVGYPPPSGGCSLIARERLGEIPRGAGSSPANWSPPPTSFLVHRVFPTGG